MSTQSSTNQVAIIRNGAKVRTSFECPEYPSRVGNILEIDGTQKIYKVLIQPIEKGKESVQRWIHVKFLSLSK